MLDLLWFLLLGHFFGDFALQSDRVALLKQTSHRTLTYHVAVYTSTVALFLYIGLTYNNSSMFFTFYTALALTFIFVEHWFQDLVKVTKFNGSKQSFFFDQAVHVLILFLLRIVVYSD